MVATLEEAEDVDKEDDKKQEDDTEEADGNKYYDLKQSTALYTTDSFSY